MGNNLLPLYSYSEHSHLHGYQRQLENTYKNVYRLLLRNDPTPSPSVFFPKRGYSTVLKVPSRSAICFSFRPQSGSLTSLVWTPDGTQLAGAGGNGSVVFGQVIERSIEWDTFEVRTRYYYYCVVFHMKPTRRANISKGIEKTNKYLRLVL